MRRSRLTFFLTALLLLLPSGASAGPCTPIARPMIGSPLESIASIPRIECLPASDDVSAGFLVFNEVANTSVEKNRYVMDGEELQTTLAAALPMGNGLTASIAVPFRTRGNGFLDDAIIGWHDAFGLPDGDTDRFDPNSYEVEGENADGSNFAIPDHSLTLADTTAALSGDSILGKPFVWTASLSVPTALSGAGHRGVNPSLDLRRQFRTNRWSFAMAIGSTYIGDRQFRSVRYEPFVWRASTKVGFDLLDRFTVDALLQVERTAVSGISGYPDAAFWAEFRGLLRMDDLGTLVLSLREDFLGYESQADVVFGLGIMTVW